MAQSKPSSPSPQKLPFFVHILGCRKLKKRTPGTKIGQTAKTHFPKSSENETNVHRTPEDKNARRKHGK